MLPVLCFGALAPAAPRLARRAGIEAALMVVLLVLVVALVGRVLAGPGVLLAGTVLAGGAIAVANVLLPPLIKRDFPHRTGVLMGVYTMSVTGAAAVAAGATVPGARLVGLGWRGGLGMWAAPAALAALVWLPMLRSRTRPPPDPAEGRLARSPLAWQVTAFFCLQSMQFYATLAWLPSIYRDHGYSPAAAGLLLSLSGLVQIPVTLLVSALAVRARDQVALTVGSTAVLGIGLAGMVLAPTAAAYLWVGLVGVGYGACFALALALFVLRAARVQETARLSAMAQSVGYLVSSCGPLLFGVVHEASGSWRAPLGLLLVLLVPQLWCGVLAGRARTLRAARPAGVEATGDG
jgi:CP family cyanate transporter-like MFS transporter